jgi:hypothetical protein
MDDREYKVNDYPDLIKRSGGVINTNFTEYAKCKKRLLKAKEFDTLKDRVDGLDSKLDMILNLLAK